MKSSLDARKGVPPSEELAEEDPRFSEFFEMLGTLVGQCTGIQFKGKEILIRSRLMRRVRQLKLRSIEHYAEYFKNHRAHELPEIISLLTTHKTEFFRENDHFNYLYQHVFPKLLLAGQPIRIWSAGCSTGEEAYSIAITFLELLRLAGGSEARIPVFQVLGTDIDSKSIQTAIEGVYPLKGLKSLQPALIDRYFIRGSGELSDWVKIKDEVWRLCDFKVMNLLDESVKLPSFNTVFARNLFIYFLPETMKKGVTQIHSHLADEGLLFVGLTEGINPATLPFMPLGRSVYKKATHPRYASIPKLYGRALSFAKVNPIRVLIVDDSATVRKVITQLLKEDSSFQVVGEAGNPLEADKILAEKQVDVMTLDIQMPYMDGVTYLRKLQKTKHPPVVMVSTLSFEESNQGLTCFELGAVDYLEKPSQLDLSVKAEELRAVLKGAASSHFQNIVPQAVIPIQKISYQGSKGQPALICIGASAGGPVALQEVLQRFPENSPPILLVQHLPKFFTQAFAKKLSETCRIRVLEGTQAAPLLPGHAYLAPGGSQMGVVQRGNTLLLTLVPGEGGAHCPSVDFLFTSIAALGNKVRVAAAILTGMGKDGALGMKELKKAGAYTVAQNEETCVVFGMPKAAIDEGAVQDTLPLGKIAGALLRAIEGGKKNAA